MIHYLNSLLSEHLAYAISWTVLHSLWQASLIALIMSWFLNRYANEDAIVRYRISYAAMIFVLGASVMTFMTYYFMETGGEATAAATTVTVSLSGDLQSQPTHVFSQLGFWISHNLNVVASMWILGVILFCFKLGGSLVYTMSLQKQKADFLPDNIYEGFINLKSKLGIRKYIHLAETSKVNTPMLIGYLKPVILFPIGLINQLTLEETNAILAHELAHVKRNDFLHNLILSVVELLFYYHPAVWWISANVRMERENCCDDLAMKLIGDKTIYAKTLLKIEELKSSGIPSLAIPLSRNKNQLLHRIGRIVNQPQTRSQIREKLIATCLLFTFFFGFGNSISDDARMITIDIPELEKRSITRLQTDCDKQNTFTIKTNIQQKPECNCDNKTKNNVHVKVAHKVTDDSRIIYIDTIPTGKKSNMTIINSSDDQEVILKMKDGRIVELEIDGQKIDEEDYDEHLDMDSYEEPDIQSILEEVQEEMNTHFKEIDKESLKHHFDLGQLEKEMEAHKEKFNLDKETQFDFYFGDSESGLSKLFEEDMPGRMKFKLDDSQPGSVTWKKHFEKMENLDSIIGTLDHFDGIVEFDSNLPHFELHEFDFPSARQFEFHVDRDFPGLHPETPTDKLIQALSQDGFLKKDALNKIELSGKHLKINGDKQPDNIYQKYKKIFEDSVGHELSKDSKIKLEYHHEEINKKNSNWRKRSRI